ncbi:DUF1236 domain-containing protein [Methylocapsa sp. D3K7]|uniref:DUF1236 domain-containing protein n=1 Tax=Methylocapsa sp. D3K7 TaxID=3041435 RepID=UPI00244ECFCB|nr:DUF1236 domain-containing protein [Methylocapsa sp. D3K7]WGJ13402.1 DUF1236 domain-containing protein [Methylocapsa sp. D3K7]
MKNIVIAAGSFAIILSLPMVVLAQGISKGAERGAAEGNAAAGPVGAVVGGVVGGVTGGVKGMLGLDQRPRFHEYVSRQRHTSYDYGNDLTLGTVLPGEGVTYYDIPLEYGVRDYRYAVINGQTVLVDPRTHRIVDIIN